MRDATSVRALKVFSVLLSVYRSIVCIVSIRAKPYYHRPFKATTDTTNEPAQQNGNRRATTTQGEALLVSRDKSHLSGRKLTNAHRLEQSRAQNILWLLEELKIDYEVEVFHRDKQTKLAPPELTKVHPLGKSPVIEIFPTGSGESIKLAESGYMTQYLCDHFGQDKNLIPKRWKDGQENKIGGETEEWMRCQYLLHYVEGSLLPVLTLSLVIGGKSQPSLDHFGDGVKRAHSSPFYQR